MTISQTAAYITEHPAFGEVCADKHEMRLFLIDLMAHVSMEQNRIDHRAWKMKRSDNHPGISAALKAACCEVVLGFRLPTEIVNKAAASVGAKVVDIYGKEIGADTIGRSENNSKALSEG